MTLGEALLTDFQAAPLRMKFLVVNYMVPQILVAGLVQLVAETVVNLVELVINQLLFQFLVEVVVLPYSFIMMYTWRRVCIWRTRCCKCNEILVTHFPFGFLVQALHWRHEMVSDI